MKVKKRSFKALHKLRSGIVDLKRLIAVLPMIILFATPLFSSSAKEPNNLGISESQQSGKIITGRVTDNKGEPLIGVNVVEAGTTNGTVTDVDGNYSLKLTTSNPILNVSYIGFKTQIINVGNRSVVNISMEEETSFLDEVVVVGYGTMKQKDLTGAISTIKTDGLKAESPRSIQDLLRGNSAGLSIGFANSAKGDASLQIRGKNTLKAGSSPLIVLDGVIYEGSLSDINPMDVQSIDVLKDASSAAVYGAKAASGVVVILT
ncbi:MAG TPA: carboxypeptidase-like regulatory domain-containing protein, partial [Paludibacteraceae bacterium]|nr:carboxypeptidase-like regulatory domain-containing protein [Paludibacteraceae bacterium]